LAICYHGNIDPTGSDRGGLLFGVIKLFEAIEVAQAFPGRNKYPTLVPWEPDQARSFLSSAGRLKDTFFKLNRAAELFDGARLQLYDPSEGGSVEKLAGLFAGWSDLPIYLDGILFYLRILVHTLANLTSQLYRSQGKKSVPAWTSFRKHLKWFTKMGRDLDPLYRTLLANNTAWFDILAGKQHGDGLRDVVVHQMVRLQLMYLPSRGGEKSQVAAFIFGRSARWKSGNLLSLIQALVRDMFVFFDRYVEHFNELAGACLGRAPLGLTDPRSSLLFEYEQALASAWLYPKIDAQSRVRKGN
jgi:hypothetical protein